MRVEVHSISTVQANGADERLRPETPISKGLISTTALRHRLALERSKSGSHGLCCWAHDSIEPAIDILSGSIESRVTRRGEMAAATKFGRD